MFKNIDSAIRSVPEGTEELILANVKNLAPKLRDVPLFLVNPSTMDKIYPPERRKVLNRECASRFLSECKDRTDDELEKLDRLWNFLEECRTKNIVAVGVYVPNPGSFVVNLVEESNPVIFICPERINSWASSLSLYKAKNKNLIEKTITALVVYHELAHAYMDVGLSINTEWERVIEESFANTIAFDLLSGNYKRRAIIREAILKQPLEYQGYTFWIDDVKYYKYFLRLWANKNRLNKNTLDTILRYYRYYDYYYRHSVIHLIERLDWFFYKYRNLEESADSKLLWKCIAFEIIKSVF